MRCKYWENCGLYRKMSICPKNMDDRCNIIPRKRKAKSLTDFDKLRKAHKMVAVRGWIRVTKEDTKWNKNPLRWACTLKQKEYTTPCTITIAAKHLEEKK